MVPSRGPAVEEAVEGQYFPDVNQRYVQDLRDIPFDRLGDISVLFLGQVEGGQECRSLDRIALENVLKLLLVFR